MGNREELATLFKKNLRLAELNPGVAAEVLSGKTPESLLPARLPQNSGDSSPLEAGERKDKQESPKPATEPKRRRNRYSEQSGELGLKVRERMEHTGNSIRLWLPYPPSANNRLAPVKGRLIKSAESRSYQKLIKEALSGLAPLTGDLKLWMTIYRPRRRGDIDNALKNCLDALTGVAFFDDEQFAQLDVQRVDSENGRKYPGLQIQITKLG